MREKGIRIEKFKNISYVKDKKGKILSFPLRYASCFIITLKGKIRFTFGEKSIVIEKGQGIFIPEGTSYINECLESAESIIMNFYLSDPKSFSPIALNRIQEKWAMSFYEEMSQKAYEKTESAQYALLSQLYRFASILFPSSAPTSQKEILAQKALSYLQSEFSRADLQMDQVASFCHVSAVYLRKVVKECYQKTPFHLLTELRMQKACELLLEKRPVKEIALAVGYSDIYQFSRAYKRYFGYSPSADLAK